jgi:hypothetical protein
MTLPLEENIRQVLKDFNLSEFNVREGFIFLSRSPTEWTEEQLIPEVFKDCLADPERPERESLLSLSALYQDGCIERRLPNDLLPLLVRGAKVVAV